MMTRLTCLGLIVLLGAGGCAGARAQPEYQDPPQSASLATSVPAAKEPAQQAASPTPAPPPPGAILPDVLVVDDTKISVNDILEPMVPRLQDMAKSQPAETYYADAAKIVKAQIVEQVAQHLIWRKANENVTDEMKKAMAGLLDPTFKEVRIGVAEVRNMFKVPKYGTIAGCMVTEGRITRAGETQARLLRDNVVVYEGKIGSLRRFKDDVSEVKSGFECGIGFERFNDLKIGDVIEVFSMVRVAVTA